MYGALIFLQYVVRKMSKCFSAFDIFESLDARWLSLISQYASQSKSLSSAVVTQLPEDNRLVHGTLESANDDGVVVVAS